MSRPPDDDPSGGGGGDDRLLHIDGRCPACGVDMRPVTLRSETSVLRCPACGQVAM